jgi:hypothetical protein
MHRVSRSTSAPVLCPGRAKTATAFRPVFDSVISVLTLLAVIASWATAVIFTESSGTAIAADGHRLLVEHKTVWFYGAHGLALCCVMAAALLSILRGRLRTVGTATRVAMGALLATTAVWAVHSYSRREVFSKEILGATGPFVWFTVLFVLAGADRRLWRYLDPLIRLLAYASALLALKTLITSGFADYRGISRYLEYTVLLVWLGGWTLLTATRTRGWRLFLRCIPVIALAPMAVLTGSLSWPILTAVLLAGFAVLRARESGALAHGIGPLVAGCALLVLAGGGLYAAAPQGWHRAIAGRFANESHGGQNAEFFQAVAPTELILGRGPKGTWFRPAVGEYKFLDNGYLWILFEGGIPTLLSYVVILIWPAIRLIGQKPSGPDAAAVFLVLLWGLALTGLSTFLLPSIQIPSYLVSLMAGRCWLSLAEGKTPQAEGASLQPA